MTAGSADVGTLYVDILARLDSLEQSLREAERRSSEAGGRAGEAFGNAFSDKAKASSQQFMGILMGLGAAAGAAGVGLVKMAGDMEMSQAAFTTLLGSGEKAKAFLADLANFAANTPFEFAGLQDSAKKLLAFGFTAQQIRPMLTAVGDAVGSLGGGKDVLDGVTMALGQMQAKGKVSAEEMNQMAERGIPAWDMLAKKIGVSIPEAMNRAAAGQISAAQAIPAILQGMEDKFGGGMEAQSKTLLGMWSNTMDTMQQASVAAGQAIVEALDLKSVLFQFNDFLGQIPAQLRQIDLKAWAKNNQDAIVAVAGALTAALLPALMEGALAAAAFIAPLLPLMAAGAAIALVLKSMGVGLDDIRAGFNSAMQQAAPFLNLLQQLGHEAKLQFMPVFSMLGEAAKAGFETVRNVVQNVLYPVFQAIAPYLQPLLASVGNLVREVAATIRDVFTGIRDVVDRILIPAFQAIWPVIKPVLDIVMGGVQTFIDFLSGLFHVFRDALNGDWGKAWEDLKATTGKALTSLENVLEKAWDSMKSAGLNLGKRLVEGLSNGLNSLKAVLLEKMADALAALEAKMPEFMKGTIERAADAARTAAGEARSNVNTPATTGYNGAGPRQSDTPQLAPAEAGKYGYAYISSLKDVFKNDPQVASDCASIATSIMYNLGQNIKGSVNAGVLEQNAIKAGYQRVSGDEIKPGDLIVWTSGNGKTYGAVSGKHVGVGAGMLNGKVMVINNPGSSNTQVEQMYDRRNATVYRAPNSPFAQAQQPVTQQPKSTALSITNVFPGSGIAGNTKTDGPITDAQIRKAQELVAALEAAKKAHDPKALDTATQAMKSWEKASDGNARALKAVQDSQQGLSKAAGEYVATQRDLQKYGNQALHLIKEQEAAQKSGDAARILSANNALKVFESQGKAQAAVVQIEQAAYQSRKSLSEKSTSVAKEQAQLRAQIADQERQLTVSAAEAAQKRLAELDRQELAAFKGTAAQRAALVKKQGDDEYAAAERVARAIRDKTIREAQNDTKLGPDVMAQRVAQARAAYDQALLEASGKRKAATEQSRKDIQAEAGQVQQLVERYAASRQEMQKLVSEGKFDPAQLREFNKSLADLWKGAQQAGIATNPLVKAAHEGAKAWGLQARSWSDAQAELLGMAKSNEEARRIEAEGFEKYGTGLEKAKANVDELLDSLASMRGELQDPKTVDNFTEHFKWMASQSLITKDQLELLLATMKDLSTTPVSLKADNLEGRGVQATETPLTDAARGYLDDAGKKAFQTMLDNFDSEGKDKAEDLGKMLAELVAKGFGESDQAQAIRTWIDNFNAEFNTAMLNAGATVDVSGNFVFPSEDELRGIGVKVEDIQENFLDLDAVLKNGVNMSLADFTAAISNIGLEPEQLEKLTQGWHEFNDAVDSSNTLVVVSDQLLGAQAQSVDDLFAQYEAGTISADKLSEELEGVAKALDVMGEGDSASGIREMAQNFDALTAARDKLAEAQGHGKGKFDADLKALEAMRGKPGVVAAELDSLIAAYQRLNKQDALEQKINKWGNYAKQIIPVVAQAMSALGGTTDEVAGQWAEDMTSMVNDLVSFGTAIAKGDYVGAAVQALTTIFGWFSRNKKAAEEAAKATADYNKQFKFAQQVAQAPQPNNAMGSKFSLGNSPSGDDYYGTRSVQKYTTGVLFWSTDHYKEKVDEVGKALALSLESGFSSGIENGFNEAIKMNDFSLFEKSLTESVGQAVLKGLIDAFMQEEVLKGIIGPRIKAVIDARHTQDGGEDDEVALANLKGGVQEAKVQAEQYYNSILKPIAQEWGLLGSGIPKESAQQGSTNPTQSVQVSIPSVSASLNFDVLQTLAGVVERAAPRIESGGQAMVEGGGRLLAAMDRLERLLGGAELKPTGSFRP